ncbi:MAG: hypothetical protein IPJ66_08130 [Bacteroidetes bacterium]|nr:hypothetical protein [Bacteroidota bacterium]
MIKWAQQREEKVKGLESLGTDLLSAMKQADDQLPAGHPFVEHMTSWVKRTDGFQSLTTKRIAFQPGYFEPGK